MIYQVDPESPPADSQAAAVNIHANFFETKQIRHNFIKKVYTLLSIQLLITVAVVSLFSFHRGLNLWTRQNQWFYLPWFVMSFVILIGITCFDKLRRKHPHNLIVLFLFTAAESLMLAGVTVMYETDTILRAAGITLGLCLALTLFAMQTKYDFTAKSGIMLVILVVATMTLMIGLLFPVSRIFVVIMSGIMATIMGIYLVIDTQMIIGGTHSVQITPEEYVFATITLFLDIINMFLYVLMILGRE